MDGLYQIYKEQLITSKNKELVLTQFFCQSLDIDFSDKFVPAFQKLLKMYGEEVVFQAILDIFGAENLDLNRSIYPIMNYFCKKNVEVRPNELIIDVSKVKTRLMGRGKKVKLNPFEEADGTV